MNVLFDLDGTLTDPGDGFVACISHALSRLECRSYSDYEIRKHIGPPLEETLHQLLKGDRAKLPAAVAFYRERYDAVGFKENMVYPGVEAALEHLRGAGARLFVATSKPAPFAGKILAHFGLVRHFAGVYGSQFDGTNSNKSELISFLLNAERLEAGSTAMVGDRSHDVVAALANGVRSVGALWGYGSREELSQAGVQVLCERPSELSEALLSLGLAFT